MKTLKLFIVALFVGSGSSLALAANETADYGQLGPGVETGAYHTSSGTSRRWESRRIDVNDSGNVKTSKEELEVVRSTGTGTGGDYVAGNTTQTAVIDSNGWVGSTGTTSQTNVCRGLIDNCNVIRLASQDNKVYVDKVRIGRRVGNIGELGGNDGTTGTTGVKLYDSRGSTNTAYEKFSWGGSSNSWTPVEMWFSSGVTVRKMSEADVFIYLGRQDR